MKITGLGESYRGAEEQQVADHCKALIGQGAMKLDWRQLPVPYNRAYDGFECAVLDLQGKKLGVAGRPPRICERASGRRCGAGITAPR